METSPKPRRPIFQPYIPVHRRNKVPTEETATTPPSPPVASPRTTPKDDSEVKRRGRGQFRAPTNDDIGNNGNKSISTSSQVDPEKPSKSPPKDKPVIDLIHGIEKLTTNSTSNGSDKAVKKEEQEEKDDWEEEWEKSSEIIVQKDKPEASPKMSSVKKSSPTPSYEDDGLTTVLDCYDFPNSFKTHHLQDMFKEYETLRGGYSIKWMDDTRALIVFEHPMTAKKAYIDNINSPFFKIRPYKGQIDRKPSGPVPRRPATTDMVARRLVHGALGVRTIKTPEQRQAEQELLKQAREQRQAQRQSTANREKEIAKAFDE